MTFTRLILALACLMSSALVAQEAQVTQLMSKDLTNLPGKEGLMITVEYPPGSSDPIHRHNAHAFVYVLEGSSMMQVRGGKEVTRTPGQTFYEGGRRKSRGYYLGILKPDPKPLNLRVGVEA
ncbi:MAG: cupin domain-containing protein [Terriglobales bacterium]